MRPSPVPALVGLAPYSSHPLPDPALARADLILSGNEGAEPPAQLLADLAGCSTEVLRRYPSAAELEATLARRLGVVPEQVLVTCGADDALDRCCRAFLDGTRAAYLPVPTFEMLLRYAALSGARLITPPWDGAYPAVAPHAAAAPLGLVALVSPNNPTGATVTAADLREAAAAAPGALVLLDHAYVEFADDDADLTALALTLPNVIVTRTLSKAYGLAGLRVGYAAGPAELIRCLRVAGAPFAVSGVALHLAARCLADPHTEPALRAFVGRVRAERRALSELLRGGAQVYPSQANFVLARFPDAARVYRALLADGIAVRAFAAPALRDCLRVTCPGADAPFERLCASLRRILS